MYALSPMSVPYGVSIFTEIKNHFNKTFINYSVRLTDKKCTYFNKI